MVTPTPCFLCMVTTASYAEGAICLAQSLEMVGSRGVLRVIATNLITYETLQRSLESCTVRPPMIVELRELELPKEEAVNEGRTHGGKGAVLSVDAPRRFLWDDTEGFVLLDADLLAVQNPDFLLDLLEKELCDRAPAVLHAVPSFRLKKKNFGSNDNNFNRQAHRELYSMSALFDCWRPVRLSCQWSDGRAAAVS